MASSLNDDLNYSGSTTQGGISGKMGVKFTTGTLVTSIISTNKHGSCTATTAYLLDSSQSQLASASFSGATATFNYALSPSTVYYVVSDAGGSNYSRVYSAIPMTGGWPVVDDSITFTHGNDGGTDTTYALNIISITTNVAETPVAAFSGTPVTGEVPIEVTFTDASTNTPTSWSWDFGDSVGTSTSQNPTYEYPTSGTFTVTLTATNLAGSDDEVKTDYVTFTDPPPPTAAFSADVTLGEAPLTVTFTDSSTDTPTSWLWNFGDGRTSTSQNPVIVYDEAGAYSVTLTAMNANGSDDELKGSYIVVTAVPSTVVGSTGGKGTAAIATRAPVTKGLTAGTTSQVGRKPFLQPVKSFVRKND